MSRVLRIAAEMPNAEQLSVSAEGKRSTALGESPSSVAPMLLFGNDRRYLLDSRTHKCFLAG